MNTDKFYNEFRFKQLIGILRNSRPEYRHALCGKSIHQVIYDVSRENNPIDWHHLILELPHLASDGNSIGYYRKDSDVAKKVTTCKAGKYIKRHFPQLSDHIIRDFVSPYIAKVKIVETMDGILHAIINGPHSCMATDKFSVHPYKVYDPEFNWSMAIRETDTGEIVGRALINNNVFVRCYASASNGNYAGGADNILESYLESKGFEHVSSWPRGTKIKAIRHHGELVAPYIDGNNDNVDDCGEYLAICSDGDYECTQTNGYADEKNKCTCSHCGDRSDSDESQYVEDFGDVCESCLNDEFTYIQETRINGRYIGGFYVLNRDAIETIDGESYPRDSYTDYDIVELHNGDYTQLDNAVYVDDSDEYYHTDDIGELIAYCEDDSEYHSDFWQCAESDKYYSENETFAYNAQGDKIHPDYATDELELVADK